MHTRGLSIGRRTIRSELTLFWAVVKKNIKIRSRYRVDFLIYTVVPLSLIVSLARNVFEALTFGPTQGMYEYTGFQDYASFTIASWVLWRYYYYVFQGTRQNIRVEQVTGTLELSFACPASKGVLVAGHCLSTFVMCLSALVAVVLSIFLMGVRLNTSLLNMPIAFLIYLLGLVGVLGIGFVSASFIMKYKEAGLFEMFLVEPMMYFSGVAYTIAALPAIARFIAYFNPVTYALDSLRGLLLGTRMIYPLYQELLILVVLSAVFLFIGMMVMNRIIQGVLEKEGIGSY